MFKKFIILFCFFYIASGEVVNLPCSNLTHIKCKIDRIPGDFFTKEIKIDAGGNPLKKLDIKFVSLGRIPQSLSTDHPDVEELEFNSCYISSLDGIYNLKKLRKLEINYNLLKEIGETHFDNPELYELGLEHNNIAYIHPNAFKKLPKLKKLELSHNNLSHVEPGTFKNLNELDLSFNLLSNVSDICVNNGNLTELSLEGNKLTKIDVDTFAGCMKLQELDIRQNPIIEVDAGVLESLKLIRKFKYDRNLDGMISTQ